jgi:16S rRNA (cytosine967-C5)-methyltransferase
MLSAIERGKTLDEARDRLDGLAPNDRAFSNAIVLATLRHYGEIEDILKPLMKRALPGRAHLARALLYIGVAQIVFLKVAPHAAINETVSATGRREQPFRGLINAVLRRVVDAMPVTPAPLNALPEWMVESWQTAYGDTRCAAIAEIVQKLPPIDLQFVSADAAEKFRAAFDAAHTPDTEDTRPTRLITLADDCLRVENAGAVEKLPLFGDGLWWVQDIAASLPTRLMHKTPAGADVLDICAAPGGKTLQLAARGAAVTALDISGARMKRLQDNLARTGLTAERVTTDFMAWEAGRTWQHILLDAPCSATGTLRRHPDLKLNRGPNSAQHMAKKQADMLDKAATLTAENGYLMFCVCSLEPAEGEDSAAAFLARHPEFEQVPLNAAHLPAGFEAALNANGGLRTTPEMLAEHGGCDGFYAAYFHKKP